jgi:hypothetical protein
MTQELTARDWVVMRPLVLAGLDAASARAQDPEVEPRERVRALIAYVDMSAWAAQLEAAHRAGVT